MAAYNGGRFIRRQIDSILPQLSEDDELIISDDGSTDGTLDIVASYSDSRIRLLHHQHKKEYEGIKYSRAFYYATDNFENALKNARGDYIFLSDQDDVWAENKVRRIVPLLDRYDCVMCDSVIIDADGKELNFFWGEKKPFARTVLVNLKRTPFLGCCMALSRRVMAYILPFPNGLICHDLWIGCLCAGRGSMLYLNEALHFYRYHEESVSPSVTGNSENPFWFRIKYRIKFLSQYFRRTLFNR